LTFLTLISQIHHAPVESAINILKSIGFDATQVGVVLGNLGRYSQEQVGKLLKDIGYSVDQVTSAVSAIYTLSAEQVAALLKDVEYTANEIASALNDVYHLSGEATAVVLQGLQYTAETVGNALGTAYNWTEDQVKSVLNTLFGTVICTELHRQGYLTGDTYKADVAFGKMMKADHPYVYNGYRFLAQPIVDKMQESPSFTKAVYVIAKPWAEEMAFEMGYAENGNLIGRLIMIFGVPVMGLAGIAITHPFMLLNIILVMTGILLYSKKIKACTINPIRFQS